MIIKRKYCTFGQLYNMDKESRLVLEQAYSIIKDEDERKRIFDYNYDWCLWNVDMGNCLPNISHIVKRFNELDRTNPFDNGLTKSDIASSEVIDVTNTYILIHLLDVRGNIVAVHKIKSIK